MTFRKWMSLLLALAMMMSCAASFAEDAGDDDAAPDLSSLTEEQLEELRELDEADEDDGEPAYVAGPVWQEMDLSEVDASTPVLYTCRIIKDDTPIYSQRVVDKAYVIARTKNKRSAELFYVGANWCIVRYNDTIGYIKREKITEVTPVDPVNTSPYGVQKSTYLATTAQTCYVRKSMSEQDDCWVVLNPGTKLSIWRLLDGWAVVPYWRTYGYIRIDELTDLIPVSPTDEELFPDSPIAAYTSYYGMTQDKTNKSRIHNIKTGCAYMSRVLQPGVPKASQNLLLQHRKWGLRDAER